MFFKRIKYKGGEEMYSESKVEVFNQVRFEESKVRIVTLRAEEFGGEYERRSWIYIGAIWLGSIWAMIKNLSKAFFIKLFKKPNTSLRKILWEMGRNPKHVSIMLGDGLSIFNHRAKVYAASWRALDMFYNYHEKVKPRLRGLVEKILTTYWMEMLENRQAVANRLKIVIHLLEDALKRFAGEPEVRIVSLACGSAQSVIEVIRRHPTMNIKAVLVDLDKSAIEAARKRAKEAKVEDHCVFIHGTVSNLEKICDKLGKPHIVEMVGLLDYRPDNKAICLIKRIRDCLLSGGYFLTSNICKNREKILLDWILLWPMVYRKEDEFAKILLEGGFSPEQTTILYEPFKIHGVAICRV